LEGRCRWKSRTAAPTDDMLGVLRADADPRVDWANRTSVFEDPPLVPISARFGARSRGSSST
jgi:hypothetical protein